MIVWLTASACVLAPDIEPEPLEENAPPEIRLSSLEPPTDGITIVDQNCSAGAVTFRVGQIRESNRRDTLYARWFVDWNSYSATSPATGWPSFTIAPTGRLDRSGTQYTLSLGDWNTEEIHTLLVVIADRPLDPGGNGMQFPEGSEGEFDIHQWTIRVDDHGFCDSQSVRLLTASERYTAQGTESARCEPSGGTMNAPDCRTIPSP